MAPYFTLKHPYLGPHQGPHPLYGDTEGNLPAEEVVTLVLGKKPASLNISYMLENIEAVLAQDYTKLEYMDLSRSLDELAELSDEDLESHPHFSWLKDSYKSNKEHIDKFTKHIEVLDPQKYHDEVEVDVWLDELPLSGAQSKRRKLLGKGIYHVRTTIKENQLQLAKLEDFATRFQKLDKQKEIEKMSEIEKYSDYLEGVLARINSFPFVQWAKERQEDEKNKSQNFLMELRALPDSVSASPSESDHQPDSPEK
ncbi:hypothetical protein BDV96DRAFT_602077 [Lophiotrema nucula]|uniref:Uncharacterized protein n=1 Tax=Lophiotrema nucula TaxID=690887 RepID=A0A6A5Z2Y8_9PLEO|nr:hypothetical protein BDV96DRAFT_602077 [Lophiotrema nucula]